jgi:fermentation-respiration switch protein FrsA (DUF1100 family)
MALAKPRSRWAKYGILALSPLLLIGALTTVATQALTYFSVHPPRERITRTPASLDLPFEDVSFLTSDGLRLAGWFLPAAQDGPAIILGHGFGRSRQEMLDVADMLYRNHYDVLLFDWRAHGESEGERTTFGYEETKDLAAALRYLQSRPDVDPQRIGVLGNSMGGAIAIRGAAILPELKAVVSDSPYPSLVDTIDVGVRRRGPLGLWPLRPVAAFIGTATLGVDPELVSPVDEIAAISPRPVLILHGGKDELIPEDTGERLYAAAGEPKYLWYAPDAAHVRLLSRYPEEYKARVLSFFDAALNGHAEQASITIVWE